MTLAELGIDATSNDVLTVAKAVRNLRDRGSLPDRAARRMLDELRELGVDIERASR